MEVKTCITRDDWVRFRLFDQRMRPATRYRRLGWLIAPPAALVGVVVGAVALFGPHPLSVPLTVPLAALALGLYLTLFLLLEKRRLARQFEVLVKGCRGQFMSGEMLLTLSEEGITASSDPDRTTWLWTQVRAVVSNGTYGYIFLYPGRALIVPQRDFPSVEVFETFMKSAVIFHWNKEKRDGATRNSELRHPGRATQPA